MRQPARPDLWEARVWQPPGPTRQARPDRSLAADLQCSTDHRKGARKCERSAGSTVAST